MRSPETAGAGGRRFGRGGGLVDRACPPENRCYFAAEPPPDKELPDRGCSQFDQVGYRGKS